MYPDRVMLHLCLRFSIKIITLLVFFFFLQVVYYLCEYPCFPRHEYQINYLINYFFIKTLHVITYTFQGTHTLLSIYYFFIIEVHSRFTLFFSREIKIINKFSSLSLALMNYRVSLVYICNYFISF